MTDTEIGIGEIKEIPVEMLGFDIRNPRFTPDHRPASNEDSEIIRALHKFEDLWELIISIATNGYLDLEPLIVIKETDKKVLTVLEGNRRLAAIRFLADPSLGERCKIPQPKHVKPSLEKELISVKVYRVKDREAAWAFIGFKHINGAQKWDAYSKAIYATNWYLTEKAAGKVSSLSELAARLGDSHDTIKRMVNGNLALMQANDAGVFRVEDRAKRQRFHFSHFYTGMARTDYAEYLGLERQWILNDTPTKDPVPADCLGRLAEVLIWIYGSDSENIEPVIATQNPDIRRLGQVLAHPVALSILKQDRNLEAAFAETTPADTRFSEAVVRAHKEVKTALANSGSYDGDMGLLSLGEDLRNNTRALHDVMQTVVDSKGMATGA